MRILLVNPPSKFLIDDNVFPTLGLLYLSAYLKREGFTDISLLDLNGNHEMPASIDCDVVGFYSNTPQFFGALELKERLNAINKNRSCVYVIGGPHVSGLPDEAAGHFDYVVAGEGERVFLDIVKGAASGKRLPGKILRYPYMDDLNKIPFPDRDLIDLKSYKYFIDGEPATTLITSRGCPFGCAFCANNAWGKTLRYRSPENVIAELKEVMSRYGYRTFMFFDDTITVHRKRMEALCAGFKSLDIRYRCFVRADTVDEAILGKMKDSGCVEVGIGMESGSQRILDLVNKGQKKERNLQAAKWCKGVGLRVKGFFVVGFPGEDRGSVNETIDFIEESGVDDLDVTIFTPYPGSKIYRDKDKYDIKFDSSRHDHLWYKGKPGEYKSTVATSALGQDEIASIRDEIERRFKKTESVCHGNQK